jgi:Flp pilus assembly pilin Flp
MWIIFSKITFKLKCLVAREEGQDLAEYALVVALISVCAIALTQSIGAWLASEFAQIGSVIASVA